MEAIEAREAKLIFNLGKYKNEKTGIDEVVFISKLNGKIVYANIKFNLKTKVSYTCDLKFSPQGRAYDVVSAIKTPVIKTNLTFWKGKEKYNEKTNDYRQSWVSTFRGEIVLADMKIFDIEPQKLYSCEMVLSPQGKAYIVELAVPALPSKAEIVAHDSPLLIVEVIIDGMQQDDLRFDCMAGDEKMLQVKINRLRQRNIADNFFVVSSYETTCRDLMQKHLSKIS